MKVVISIDEDIDDTVVHIQCNEITEEILQLQNKLKDQSTIIREIKAKKDEVEYYIPLDDVLFFESFGRVIVMHTKKDSFVIKDKLYELEVLLPNTFIRVSKSSIVNIKKIYAINKRFVSTGVIEFKDCDKDTSISRSYYKIFNERINEVRG